jgi:heme/copper-type cytochrome/quinol oxidase subunit 4
MFVKSPATVTHAVGAAEAVLIASLAASAAFVFGYRVYRLTKGGPMPDVIGGAILAVILALVAVGVASGGSWARWVALGYGLLFGVVVMPIWVLGVLFPMNPRLPDYAFTALYWLSLVVIVVAAIAA